MQPFLPGSNLSSGVAAEASEGVQLGKIGQDILACAHRWLARFVPFFTEQEPRQQGFGYRLFVSQVEYCTNRIFGRERFPAGAIRCLKRIAHES
ncbi:MAG: hypothetical protein HYS12_08885 [Planctomycetes bacterium]|nr:hypothetical protein [Planctomycetota bacterium]